MAGCDVVENGCFNLNELLLEKREVFNCTVKNLNRTCVVLDGIAVLADLEFVRGCSLLDLALGNNFVDLWPLLLLLFLVSF